MNDNSDPEVKVSTDILEPKEESETSEAEDKSIIIASDLFPEQLLIVPLYDRPLFPKMMLPVIISDEELEQHMMKVMKDSLKYIGLVFSFRENEEDEGKLSETGVVAKIVQASKQANAPLQVVVQVMERFEIVKLQKEKPVIQARVRYWYDSDPGSEEELKAYSVSIINAIKELVQLNPLFKEELGLLMGRVNLKEPGTLADFSASMTTASGKELQKILETRRIKQRIEKALILLKHELEVSKLQSRISQKIEERMSQQQRERKRQKADWQNAQRKRDQDHVDAMKKANAKASTSDEAASESVEIAEVGGSQGEADLAQGKEAAEVSSGSSAKEAAEGIQWFEGIKEDIRVRLPLLKSDWDLSDANLLKIFSATMFAYFSESSQIHILNRIDFLKVSGQSIPGPCSS